MWHTESAMIGRPDGLCLYQRLPLSPTLGRTSQGLARLLCTKSSGFANDASVETQAAKGPRPCADPTWEKPVMPSNAGRPGDFNPSPPQITSKLSKTLEKPAGLKERPPSNPRNHANAERRPPVPRSGASGAVPHNDPTPPGPGRRRHRSGAHHTHNRTQ